MTPTLSDQDAELMSIMLYADAIIGVGFPSIAIGMEAEQKKLAHFTGNQVNPEWRWSREALETHSLSFLTELYTELKGMTL